MAKERKDVPQNRKWNTEDIFASQKEWDDLYASLEGKLDFSAYKGKLKDAETILACMEGINAVVKDLSRLSVYAFMRRDEDTRKSEFDALQSRVQMLSMKFSAGVSFITPELTALPVEKLEELAADPRLKDYDYTIRGIIKDKPHVLSEEIETLLSQESRIFGGFQNIFSMINNADLPYPTIRVNGEKVRLTHGTYGLMLHSPDRRVRRAAFKAFNKVYMDLNNTITATFVGNIDKDVFLARTRKYNSCLEMALAGEDVDVQVYKNLLDSVNANLPLLHRYFKDRKKILGVKTLHMYDIYTSLVENAEIQVDYEEAFNIVKEGLAPLGEQYAQLLQEAHDNGWIDVEETEGKRSGAYSISVFGLKHPYVLLNYQKTTGDVFTVAHELGHAMHSYFSDETQDYVNHDYKIMVAEVASTVNEVLLTKYLLAHESDPHRKAYILNHFLEGFRTTVFRQTLFAEFERESHKMYESGTPLTAITLSELYHSLISKYYEGAEINEIMQYEWSYIPHFYNAFYVYQYATGFCSAVAIAGKIANGEDPSGYLRFLTLGGSDYPLEELKSAGVDLTRPDTVADAMKIFDETIDELTSLIG